MALTQDVTPREVCLKQRELFHRESAHLFLVERTTKCFKPRDHALPRIGRHVVGSSVVWCDSELHEDVSLVAKSQVAQRCFRVAAGGALGDVQSAADLDELGWGALEDPKLDLDVLVRSGL